MNKVTSMYLKLIFSLLPYYEPNGDRGQRVEHDIPNPLGLIANITIKLPACRVMFTQRLAIGAVRHAVGDGLDKNSFGEGALGLRSI